MGRRNGFLRKPTGLLVSFCCRSCSCSARLKDNCLDLAICLSFFYSLLLRTKQPEYSLSQASSTPSRKIYDSLLTHYDTHLSLMTSQSSSSSDQPKSHSPTNLHNPPQTLSKPTRMINQVSLSQSQSQRQRSPNKTSNKHTHGNRVTSSTFLKRPVDRVSWRKKPVFLEKKLGELEDDGWDWGREEGLVSSENQLERKQARGDEVGHVGLKQVWEKAWDGLDDGGVGPWNR